jgi:hypothetical protein
MPKVDDVQMVTFPTPAGREAGYGFVVRDDNGRPAGTFSFVKREEADASQAKMQEALAACKHIQGQG